MTCPVACHQDHFIATLPRVGKGTKYCQSSVHGHRSGTASDAKQVRGAGCGWKVLSSPARSCSPPDQMLVHPQSRDPGPPVSLNYLWKIHPLTLKSRPATSAAGQLPITERASWFWVSCGKGSHRRPTSTLYGLSQGELKGIRHSKISLRERALGKTIPKNTCSAFPAPLVVSWAATTNHHKLLA